VELSANYGSSFAERLSASKRAICTGGDTDNVAAAFFYGEAVIEECNGINCFPHRYGGGMRMFEFLSLEIKDSAYRFKCPAQVRPGAYASIFSPNNLLELQKEIILRMSPVADISCSSSSPGAPRMLTMLLSRDSHLNNFHSAGEPCFTYNICHQFLH